MIDYISHQLANISPASYNADETHATLRYANRAKNIKNKAHINEDPKDAMLREFQKEIEALKAQLDSGKRLLSLSNYNIKYYKNQIMTILFDTF